MKVAYFDAFSGAAGDMIIASLLDAGCDQAELERTLSGLRLEEYRIEVRSEMRHGIAATRFIVHVDEPHHHHHGHGEHHHHHRTWADIREMIHAADLPSGARDRAVAIFSRLAKAEAAVHGTEPDAVHFHEVGAVDSIVDIVGAAVALELMGVEQVVASPLVVGSGTVKCAHGVLPVPAPATAELLQGVPLRPAPSMGDNEETGELLTPTGAAILTTLADRFGPPPAMTPESVGYGAGSRQGAHAPNVLRVMIGQAAAADGLQADGVWVIETNLDDTTAEVVADATDRLLSAGALDVFTMAATMKKGRTGLVLSCLAHDAERALCEQLLFEHTGTFGVRRHWCQRSLLARHHESVETAYGSVRIKVGRMGDRDLRAAPEFEDCRQAAQTAGVSVQAVMQAAIAAYQERDHA